MSAPLPPRLLLYDGVCGMCDQVVQWVLEHDPAGHIHFAALQGETATALRARHPQIPEAVETIVLVQTQGGVESVSFRSAAAFGVAAALGGAWRHLAWFRWLPRPLTDLGYRMIARVRYHIWGRLDACRIPRPEERGRFLP